MCTVNPVRSSAGGHESNDHSGLVQYYERLARTVIGPKTVERSQP